MTFKSTRSDLFREKYKSLTKKDNGLRDKLKKKMQQILENPESHDMKSYNLKGIYSVHVNPYVILYRIKNDTVEFVNVDHHDKVYRQTIK